MCEFKTASKPCSHIGNLTRFNRMESFYTGGEMRDEIN